MCGTAPAGVLVVIWAAVISACFYRILIPPMRGHDGGSSVTLSKAVPAATATATATVGKVLTFKKHAVPISTTFIVTACITIAVNTLYIYSTQQALGASLHFGIQLSLSIFRLMYAAVAYPLLALPIRSSVENVRFRFILLTINSLLIPCVVTALTSDACFQVKIYICSSCLGLCELTVENYASVYINIMHVLTLTTGLAVSSRCCEHTLLVSHLC